MTSATEAISQRAQREIEHGRKLATGHAESMWGWATPAGQERAKRRAELIGQQARLGPGVRALEIGCGTGNFTQDFADSGANITAIDISDELLELARQRNLPPDRVRFDRVRFEDCALEDPFDAVIGSSVLHHLDIETAVNRIFDLLRPGGVMSFAEPNWLNPQVFLERKLRRLPMFNYVSQDETAIVRWGFAKTLARAGFVDIRITPHDWLHPSTPRPLVGVVKKTGRFLEHIPIVREFSGALAIRARRPR